MKIKLDKNVLIDALSSVGKAIGNSKEILECINLKAVQDKVLLKGTNLDLSIQTFIEADVEEEGEIVCQFKIFNDIIRKMPSEISLETSDDNVIISSKKSTFTLVTRDVDEFPKEPEFKKEKMFSIEGAALKRLILESSFAASQDDTRPILQGILMEGVENQLNLVALDGYRIAKVSYKNDIPQFSIVVMAKHLVEIAKLIKNEDINIAISTNQVLFKINNTIIMSRLLEGQYIDYSKLMPTSSNFEISLFGEELKDAIERSSLLLGDSKIISLSLSPNSNILKIEANSQKGSCNEEVSVEVEGLKDTFKVAFNFQYLIDIFRHNESEEFILKFTTNVAPCIINPKDGNALYLALPVRIK